MEYIKIQIGCMVVLLFLLIAYIKDSSEKGLECHRVFDVMLGVAPFAIFFDGFTAWSVNQLDRFPAWLNLLLHALFYISMDVLIILLFLYIVDLTLGIKNKKHMWILMAPGIFAILIVLFYIPQTYYVQGKITNYSMGISAVICYVSLILHELAILYLLIRHRASIEKKKIFGIIVTIAMNTVIIILQSIFPELLITSLAAAITILGIYINFENPSTRQLKAYNKDMVVGFSTLVENRDNSTGGHINRTTEYVKIILKQMALKEKYRPLVTKDYFDSIITATPMHDVGKIATPDSILQKQGKLTEEEFEIMKQHASTGGEIINEVFASFGDEEYKKIAYEVARYHHEKWNGKGYPEGLSEEEIPLHARIMSIADVFDAVSAKRCYRDALPLEVCFEIIEEGIGEAFDPDLARLFLNAKEEVIKVHNQYRD